jgi:hypothetical protein
LPPENWGYPSGGQRREPPCRQPTVGMITWRGKRCRGWYCLGGRPKMADKDVLKALRALVNVESMAVQIYRAQTWRFRGKPAIAGAPREP